jgi:rubrerythrin
MNYSQEIRRYMKVFIKSTQLIIAMLMLSTAAVQAQQMQMPQIAPAKDVTDAELEQFVEVAKEFQEISVATDRMLIAKLEELGMSGQRFQEIMMARQNPTAPQVELTPLEETTMKNMQSFLQELSASMQQQQIEAVGNSELSEQRFQGIAMALQTDEELAERFQELVEQ